MYMVSLTQQRELAFFKVEKSCPSKRRTAFKRMLFILFRYNFNNAAIQLLGSKQVYSDIH